MLLHVNVMVMLLRCEGKFTARVQIVFNWRELCAFIFCIFVGSMYVLDVFVNMS